MKVEIRDLTEVQKEMSIEVTPEEVDKAFDRAVRDVRKQVTIPGFRKGKAPREVVGQRYAKEVGRQVEEKLTAESISEAFQDKEIRPLGYPRRRTRRRASPTPSSCATRSARPSSR